MNWQNAKVVGYFSIPSAAMAEEKPEAYSLMMGEIASKYPNAGYCGHCGTPITHHVVVMVDGKQVLIGTTCAEKVGIDPEALRCKVSSEEREKRDAEREARHAERSAKFNAEKEMEAAILKKRREMYGDLIDGLVAVGGEFAKSLSSQLEAHPLSDRQAKYAVKMLSDTGHRNKKNGEWWDNTIDRLTGYSEM